MVLKHYLLKIHQEILLQNETNSSVGLIFVSE